MISFISIIADRKKRLGFLNLYYTAGLHGSPPSPGQFSPGKEARFNSVSLLIPIRVVQWIGMPQDSHRIHQYYNVKRSRYCRQIELYMKL